MKGKKILMYIGILILILIVIGLGTLIYINNKNNTEENNMAEYIPESEITDEQLRQTIITLYFLDMETTQIMPEITQIDSKDLLENPYRKLIELLIEGPKNEKLIKLIPEETALNNVEINNGIVYVDFSDGFIQNQTLGEEQEMLIINSIVNTLTELTEVNAVKILIDGQENKQFPDNKVDFTQHFSRN